MNIFPEEIEEMQCLSQCVRSVRLSCLRLDVDWNHIAINMGGITQCHKLKREMKICEFWLTR